MYSPEDLSNEIQDIFNEFVSTGRSVHVDWLTNSVMEKHKDIYGEDKEFYTLCAYAHIKVTIRAVVRQSKPNDRGETNLPQLTLPGFQRLQTHYHVERDHEICLIRIDELSDGELDLKAHEYEAMAEGCRLHAAELRRYKQERHSAAAV